jgi:hypothetical protein
MTGRGRSPLGPTIDLEDLGFDRGAHVLVERALAGLAPGATLGVRGRDPHLRVHLPAWARAHGHQVRLPDPMRHGAPGDGASHEVTLVRGTADKARWRGAVRAGGPGPGGVIDRPPPTWGLAARGALVEDGGPPLRLADLDRRDEVWADIAPKLYAQALAGQWDPATAVDWSAPVHPDPSVEAAVVQVMTYLVENEQAALVVPARFIARIHPHFREVVQLLAVQTADEARHVEVFTRRAQLSGGPLGTSGAGGRASLQTLLDEPDFSLAAFLLSVLGEGTFLDLLSFLERHGPDPATRRVAHLALADEARHVAFGVAHLEHRVAMDPAFRGRLRAAVERRHDVLASTTGLHDGVYDALVVLAAGAWTPTAVATGWDRVQALTAAMDEGRRRRLARLGFPPGEAADLSALHTRNFM